MDFQKYDFSLESLKDYFFELDEEKFCGYDEQGKEWYGEELIEKSRQGLIVKESPSQMVFHRKRGGLLGYIHETFDGSWWAYSPYYPPRMSWIDVFGFRNEFYAVRYLHQVSNSQFPDNPQEIPCLPEE